MQQIFLIVLVALVGGALVYAGILSSRKRREGLRAVALRLGLHFDPGTDRALHRFFGHSLFKKGRSRQATNNIFGSMEIHEYSVEVRMGDYQYTTGSGKNQHTQRLSYACFRLPFVGTPDLTIRKEGIGDKLAGSLGFDDIDFESEEFSRKFWVKSGDKRYAYDVIHTGMMEFLLKGPTPTIEIVQDVCLVREGWGRWEPDTFEGAPGWFDAFLKRWPEHLIDQLRPRQETGS